MVTGMNSKDQTALCREEVTPEGKGRLTETEAHIAALETQRFGGDLLKKSDLQVVLEFM